MRLRWILLPLGVLAVAAAAAYYVFWVPPMVADDYEKRAEPEHLKAEDALKPVVLTFHDDTVGTFFLKRRKDPAKYLRSMRRQQARDLRELKSAQRAVRKAKRRLKRIDREAMTDAPERPLLNGRDDLKDAAAVADEERDYLRKLDAFVSDYEKLLGYTVFSYEAQHRFSVAIVQAQVQIPARPTSLGQITGPLDRGIRRAAPAVKQFKRRRPPRPMRKEHRDVLRDLEHVLEQQRAVAAAIRRDDFDRANAIDRRVRKKADRSRKTSTEELRRFINRSRYSKQIDDLNKRELAIRKLFEDL